MGPTIAMTEAPLATIQNEFLWTECFGITSPRPAGSMPWAGIVKLTLSQKATRLGPRGRPAPLARLGRLVGSLRGFIREVGVRYFAMVLVAFPTAGTPAIAEVDPAVMAMLREWSLTSPNPSSVVICHGFGCAFRTEIALTDADRAQMA